jgi:hypothetical protein
MDKTNNVKKNPIPYLHPSDRVLRSEQVGISNHQNQYNTGVLMGNWVAERGADETKLPPNAFNANTVHQTSFQHPQDLNPNALKRENLQVHEGLEKEIIFAHGQDLHDSSYVTMNQLVHSHHDNTKTDQAINRKFLTCHLTAQ